MTVLASDYFRQSASYAVNLNLFRVAFNGTLQDLPALSAELRFPGFIKRPTKMSIVLRIVNRITPKSNISFITLREYLATGKNISGKLILQYIKESKEIYGKEAEKETETGTEESKSATEISHDR